MATVTRISPGPSDFSWGLASAFALPVTTPVETTCPARSPSSACLIFRRIFPRLSIRSYRSVRRQRWLKRVPNAER